MHGVSNAQGKLCQARYPSATRQQLAADDVHNQATCKKQNEMGRLRVAAGCWLLPAACSKVVTVSLREAEMWVGELAAIEGLRSEWVGADNVQNSTDSARAQETRFLQV